MIEFLFAFLLFHLAILKFFPAVKIQITSIFTNVVVGESEVVLKLTFKMK